MVDLVGVCPTSLDRSPTQATSIQWAGVGGAARCWESLERWIRKCRW